MDDILTKFVTSFPYYDILDWEDDIGFEIKIDIIIRDSQKRLCPIEYNVKTVNNIRFFDLFYSKETLFLNTINEINETELLSDDDFKRDCYQTIKDYYSALALHKILIVGDKNNIVKFKLGH